MQSTLVMGEGKNPGVQELLRLGKQHRIPGAQGIIDKVQAALTRWKVIAEEAGVSARNRAEIASRLGFGKS